MYDDHGTLRDEHGRPKTYRVCQWPLPNVPLAESQVWPEDMLMMNALRNGHVVKVPCPPGREPEAQFHVERVEATITRRLGAVPCSEQHDGSTCSACGAAR